MSEMNTVQQQKQTQLLKMGKGLNRIFIQRLGWPIGGITIIKNVIKIVVKVPSHVQNNINKDKPKTEK